MSIDFGTLSARALVVRIHDGAEVGMAVHEYRHGVIDRTLPATGAALPGDWALQDPQDYLDALRTAVPTAVAASGVAPAWVVGIGTDFTASTVLPVRADGTPLSCLPQFASRPHAYVKLWKHHAAQAQADRINEVAADLKQPWLRRYGGRISAEWQFAKGLQLLEEDPACYAAADRYIEAADWIVWQLCGRETRNVCTAGYKGIYQDGRYPSREFLAALNPDFTGFVADKLERALSPLGARAGGLTARAAAWTGLPEGIAVSVGNVDAHVTAPAARALHPGQLLAVMGTSTCHIAVGPRPADVPGACGAVYGGVIDDLWGFEAGQSGVGDIFAWFINSGLPQSYLDQAHRRGLDAHEYLSDLAMRQRVGAHGLLALDWHNGNRSVLVDHELSGLMVGLTLATTPEDIYRALVEATAFGTRRIIAAFEESGVPVTEMVVAGGLLRNPFIMQVYADVVRRPLSVIGSSEGPALGSAIHAAVAAGAFPHVRAAAAVMGKVQPGVYRPDTARADAYDDLYADYVRLHDHFGRASDLMHRLRRLRNGPPDADHGAAERGDR